MKETMSKTKMVAASMAQAKELSRIALWLDLSLLDMEEEMGLFDGQPMSLLLEGMNYGKEFQD